MNKFKLSLLGCLIGATSPMLHAATAGQSMVNPQSGVVVGYWHNWCGGAGYQGGTAPCVKLDQVNPQYNVVDVSFMKVYGSNPIPTFKLDTATGMSESQFIEQIAELNRQGRAVLLALGGADAHIELRTGQEQAFADEIIRLVETYGFDGLDIDLEQAAVTAANNQTVIPAALRLVKDHYRAQGKNFLITMAPEFPYLTANGLYTPYLRALEGYYDWINPQFYNQGGDGIWIDGIGWIAQNNDALKEEFIYYIADSLINGTRGYYKIPHDKLVFGIPTNIDAAATGYVKNPQDLFDAFNKLKNQGQPLRGVMTWSINWDMGRNAAGQSYNESFIKSYGPFIHEQEITPPIDNGKPVFSGVSDTRIKQGTAFDPLAGVTANDKEDGDLTGQIQVEGSVDSQRIGLYPLTYKVSDRDNNVTEQVRSVEVYSMKPVFSGVTDTTLELGTPFDPMTGVSAHDEEDGDLTAQIKVNGSVDSNKVGRYTLTYQVSDSAGQLVTQQRNVTVKEQGAICENSWDAKKVYVGGDIVSHNGKNWLAGWWTQNEEPGTTGDWGVWKVQGDSDCDGGNKPPVINSSDFTVSAMGSDYTIVNGQVSIRFNVTTANPVQITATLEQNGRSHGTTSSKVNGTSTLVLQGSNVTDGSYDVVITGLADGQKPVVQRFPVTLAEESDNGGNDGDYPAYAPNTGYQAGDRVSNAGGNYECKPWPYSGWCGGSTSHYAPGTGSAWSDAWTKL
ncbi:MULTISPECIES: immunoglobulin-like domain-containing protein [Aeromonas]|uniref:immunoglobulin-like domain-containing protein n=1 Tax=Aeromonas TaxID=642 RepID=UPI0011176FEC|nr:MULTISPECIES: immunoglobulin-like domain-containing protein [Aeromonas]TNI85919.1 chitinase [Aeromonas allosaccharophila]